MCHFITPSPDLLLHPSHMMCYHLIALSCSLALTCVVIKFSSPAPSLHHPLLHLAHYDNQPASKKYVASTKKAAVAKPDGEEINFFKCNGNVSWARNSTTPNYVIASEEESDNLNTSMKLEENLCIEQVEAVVVGSKISSS